MLSSARQVQARSQTSHPLNIGLRADYSAKWVAGVIYVTNVIKCLQSLPKHERPNITLLRGSSDIHPDLSSLVQQGLCSVTDHDESSFSAKAFKRLRRAGLSKQRTNEGLDVIYPAGEIDPTDSRRLHWVPDFQHEHMPELFSAAELNSRREYMKALSEAGGTVVLSSEAAKRDFTTFYPQATTQAHVWSFPSLLEAKDANAADPCLGRLPAKFFYIANQFWAHKDHETAFNALRIAREDGVDIHLVCTGREDDPRRPGFVDGLKKQLAEAGLLEQVTFLGLVPRAAQIEIFRRAAAVLQPSRFEGWSTVVEDARALGKTVLLSDIPVHREQMDDAVFFPTGDAMSLASQMMQLWPQLSSGPNAAHEDAAAARQKTRSLEQARKLMMIFQSVAAA